MNNLNKVQQETAISSFNCLNDSTSYSATMDEAVFRQQRMLGKKVAEELQNAQQKRETDIEAGRYVHGATQEEARRIMDAGGYVYGLC